MKKKAEICRKFAENLLSFIMSLKTKSQYEPFNQKLHVAIIMDGNGRWATEKKLTRKEGHNQGANVLHNLVQNLPADIGILTVYAFSLENWSRSLSEVYHILKMAHKFLEEHLETFIKEGIKVQFLGDRSLLPNSLVTMIQKTETETEKGSKLLFNIALSYGSRQEILQAIDTYKTDLSDKTFEDHLLTNGMKDPDLLIRTGGEKRLSNYLLWQLAYTELFFLDILWPDFTLSDLNNVLKEYYHRNKKYGFA